MISLDSSENLNLLPNVILEIHVYSCLNAGISKLMIFERKITINIFINKTTYNHRHNIDAQGCQIS